eukprot:g1855.t1
MVAEEGQRYLPVSDEKAEEEEEEEEDSEELHVPLSRAVATKFTVCGRFSACMRMTVAGLPLCFLMLYVLDAFILTFPDTAYMHLINEELKVSQSDQSIFYATIMVPWYFKPFYGWIVSRGYSPVSSSSSSSSSSSASNHDTAPTSPSNVSFTRLSKYIIAASVGSAASYLLTSTAVYSLTNLYLATLLRALSNAFSELCLGVILVSFAEATSRKRVGVMQSAASGARAAGSLLAWKHIQWRSIMPAIFLFAFNATPSAEIQWSNMTYNIFEKKLCYVQYSSVISMTASTIGAALYARVCNKRPTHVAIVFATCLSVCAGLLRLPLALEWNNFVGANHDDDMCGQPGSNGFFRWMYEDTFASDCTDVAFEYLAVATTIMGIFSQCAMVPLIVLAVERCPLSKAGVWYGMFLASMSLGVSVSGWVTAPLVSKLGITFNNFEGLGSLILIESASKIAMLLLIPLLALNGAILAPCSSIVPKSPHRRSSSDVPRDAHCRDKKSYELNDGTKACSSEDEDNAILAFARNATTDARFHARLSEPILLGIPRGRSH